MIGTFIARIPSVTVHVLHGKPQSVLGVQGGALTSKCQLRVRAGLDCAQTYTRIVLRVVKNIRFLVAGYRAARAKKAQSFNHIVGRTGWCADKQVPAAYESGLGLCPDTHPQRA